MKYWVVKLIEHCMDDSNHHTEKEIERRSFNTKPQANKFFDNIIYKIQDEYKYKIMYRVFQTNEYYISTERKNGTWYTAELREY